MKSPTLVICAAAFAVFAVAAFRVPVESDELLLMSSVARTSNPLSYFAGDSGIGNAVYRPLHSLTQWASYRVFGVWALPDQIVNLLLHTAVIVLLFEVLTVVSRDAHRRLMLLLSLAGLVSLYTYSAASWIADRPTLWVALCLLLAIRQSQRGPAGATALVALSGLALISKDTGLVVAVLVALCGWLQGRPRLIAASAALVVGFVALRWVLFADRALVYSESGVLLGIWPYDDATVGGDFLLRLIDNSFKHVVAIALPIFEVEGSLTGGRRLLVQAPFWISTAVMVAAVWSRPTGFQCAALAVIGVNAILHALMFRHRVLYISHLALLVFVAGSSQLANARRRTVVTISAAVLVAFSVFRVEQALWAEVVQSRQALDTPALDELVDAYEGRIDPRIVEEVRRRYAR